MSYSAKQNFVEQQGLTTSSGPACELQYAALMFQPRLLGLFVLAGLISQSWIIFLALSAILWWNVFVPALNPFDAIYNSFLVHRTASGSPQKAKQKTKKQQQQQRQQEKPWSNP